MKEKTIKRGKELTDLPQSITTPPSSHIVTHLQVNPIRMFSPNAPADTHVTHNTVRLKGVLVSQHSAMLGYFRKSRYVFLKMFFLSLDLCFDYSV